MENKPNSGGSQNNPRPGRSQDDRKQSGPQNNKKPEGSQDYTKTIGSQSNQRPGAQSRPKETPGGSIQKETPSESKNNQKTPGLTQINYQRSRRPINDQRPRKSRDDQKQSDFQTNKNPGGSLNQDQSLKLRRLQNDHKPGGSQVSVKQSAGSSETGEKQSSAQYSDSPKLSPKEVSFPEEENLKKAQQSKAPQQKMSKDQTSSAPKTSEEEEKGGFFFNLFPDSGKDWAALLAKLSRPDGDDPVPKEFFLKREMGLFSAVNFLITISVGAGIFTNPPVLLERTGSTTEALLVWLFCGIFSLLIAITYGELVFLVSQSGEKFSYLLAAYSPINKIFGPIPAFLSMWIDSLFVGPAQVSLFSLLFAEHLYIPISSSLKTYTYVDVTEPYRLKQVIGVIVLVIITCINFQNMKTCVIVQNMFGVVKMLICLTVISGGLYNRNTGSFDSLFKDMKGNSTGLLKAVYRGMWTYEGWSNVVTISEEIINPLRTIPAAIIIGVPIVTVLYLAMNVSFLCVLTASEITAAPSKFLFIFGERLFGPESMVMPTFFAISALSCSMGVQLGVSRACFAGGREGHTLEVLSYIHVHKLVPIPAVLAQALLSLVFIVYIPAIDLIEYASFIVWTFYGFSFVALIILRATMPDTYRLYKTPLFIPIILTVLSVLVTLEPLQRAGGTGFFVAIIFMSTGVLVYFQFVYRQKRIPCMDKFNSFIRARLNVVPPTALPEGYSHTPSPRRTFTIANRLQSGERYYSNV